MALPVTQQTNLPTSLSPLDKFCLRYKINMIWLTLVLSCYQIKKKCLKVGPMPMHWSNMSL